MLRGNFSSSFFIFKFFFSSQLSVCRPFLHHFVILITQQWNSLKTGRKKFTHKNVLDDMAEEHNNHNVTVRVLVVVASFFILPPSFVSLTDVNIHKMSLNSLLKRYIFIGNLISLYGGKRQKVECVEVKFMKIFRIIVDSNQKKIKY